MNLSFTIPIKLVSSANLSEHWAKKRKREMIQKASVKYFLAPSFKKSHTINSIELIRLGPKNLDYDNLVYAFKHIRDCISDLIHPNLAPGQADKDLHFTYSQQTSHDYSIIINIT